MDAAAFPAETGPPFRLERERERARAVSGRRTRDVNVDRLFSIVPSRPIPERPIKQGRLLQGNGTANNRFD